MIPVVVPIMFGTVKKLYLLKEKTPKLSNSLFFMWVTCENGSKTWQIQPHKILLYTVIFVLSVEYSV